MSVTEGVPGVRYLRSRSACQDEQRAVRVGRSAEAIFHELSHSVAVWPLEHRSDATDDHRFSVPVASGSSACQFSASEACRQRAVTKRAVGHAEA